MAIGADFVRNRRFEIAVGVALHAPNLQVFPQKREVRRRVIEGAREGGLLPRCCVVTRLAPLLKRTLVRINTVTVCTFSKWQAGIARLAVGSWRMTAFAKNVAVFAREREARPGVIEAFLAHACGLPIDGGMATCTVRPQASLVLIHVASAAAQRQAHPCVAQILVGQQGPCRCGNVLRCMTRPTAYSDMLSVQCITGLRVIESGRRRIPVDHLEICAVMVGVTFDACRSFGAALRICRMQTTVLAQFGGDLVVALEAAECRSFG